MREARAGIVFAHAPVFARALAFVYGVSVAACGGPDADASLALRDAAAPDDLQPRDDESVPAITDRAALTAWLGQRYYRGWSCESRARDGRSAVHARMRTCRNEVLLNPPADGDYHVGAAAVAELTDDHGSAVGTALVVRGLPDPGATGWYFYERLLEPPPLALGEPIEADGTLADGYGEAGGNAQTVCAACHVQAARDFVFKPGT